MRDIVVRVAVVFTLAVVLVLLAAWILHHKEWASVSAGALPGIGCDVRDDACAVGCP